MPKNEFTCDCNAVNLDLVEKTLSKMPDNECLSHLADFFKLLGDGTRCKMLFALLQNEMCVCDLANVLSMTKSSISHQLSTMRRHGIVKCRRAGKEVYYSLDDHHVTAVFEVAMTHIMHKEKDACHQAQEA